MRAAKKEGRDRQLRISEEHHPMCPMVQLCTYGWALRAKTLNNQQQTFVPLLLQGNTSVEDLILPIPTSTVNSAIPGSKSPWQTYIKGNLDVVGGSADCVGYAKKLK